MPVTAHPSRVCSPRAPLRPAGATWVRARKGSVLPRRLVAALALPLAMLSACDGEAPGAPVTPAAPLEPFTLPGDTTIDWEQTPFELRLARLHPTEHLEESRLCDLVRVSEARPIRPDHPRYGSGVTLQQEVRCQADTGEAWGTLFYADSAAEAIEAIVPGKRLRVMVIGADPIELEYLAIEGDAAHARSDRWAYEPIPIGAPIHAPRTGQTHACMVSWASDFVHFDNEGWPWRRLVHCAHPLGADAIDVAFAPDQERELLILRRGAQAELRVRDPAGGRGERPLAEIVSLSSDPGANP